MNKTPHATDVAVGQRIRARRRMMGISQTELGKSIGVTFQQVQKYERGANRIGASRLLMITTALSVSVHYLFEGLERKPSDEPDPLEGLRCQARSSINLIKDEKALTSLAEVCGAVASVGHLREPFEVVTPPSAIAAE